MNFQDKLKLITQQIPFQKAHSEREIAHHLGEDARKILCGAFIILGICCLLFTDAIHESLPYILGSIMVILGVIHMIHGLHTREYKQRETKLTANGILFFILGIVIFCNHKNADTLIGSIWGVFGLIKGTEELNDAIYYFSKKGKFIRMLLEAAVSFVLGFLLLIDPINSIHHHVFLLGLELMVSGIELLMEEFEPEGSAHSI